MLKIYVCGPTVYNEAHIGNLRPILTFDLILKGYRFLDEKFIFVHNITDIDDKIINRAIEQNKNELEISKFYEEKYFECLKKLNVDTISYVERVTNNMELITNYINKIFLSKNAYKDIDGNIWFDVKKNSQNYGLVSNQNLNKMIFEEENKNKKFEADFALWKKTNKGIQFQSLFGPGRPGWHTECCALIDKHFGQNGVDIHGGGMDLTFPHHENENIQHFALYSKHLAKKWIRTGQINLDGIKMSKSLGNTISISEFLEKNSPDLLKLIILNSKLTAPINITDEWIDYIKSIEDKYQKLIFKFFITFDLNEFKNIEKNNEQKQIFESLKNCDFSQYNFLLNEQIKSFNKTQNINFAKNIYQVLNIIHPDITNEYRYKDALTKFHQWRLFIDKKDYKKADIIRDELIKNKFY
ncbi:cysteine--tRNA ligase [Mycoplasmopsis lipofaciens]|uniref:hypothetical protein n=1 Tax=Mycoplasmopsis lipofaciens TaxID=114884 RepID=UPI000481C059|nr:hypothetical protein [Mycoplasmopsis lipofaciens]